MGEIITPRVAADIIIELIDRKNRPIVLIERKNPPHGWAIPGGFVDVDERVERAACREALEETGLKVRLKALVGIYSKPGRDPRFHTVTILHVAEARGEPRAMDDAKNLQIVPVDELPSNLAFDHDLMLEDYLQWRDFGVPAPIRMD